MHIFVRANRTLVIESDAAATVESVKCAVERREGVPCEEQRLVYAGKQLEDGRSLAEYGVCRDSTVHLVLRVLGGKGGFGALLRSGARASHTQNFDACRDLSGRRLRHVTADEKLAEWAADASERELEKVALQHIKEQGKAVAREARKQVDVDQVKEQHQQKLSTVLTAMQEALAASGNRAAVGSDNGLGHVRTGAKRSGSTDSTDSPSPPAKRRNRGLPAFDELSSDSEDDAGDAAQAAVTVDSGVHGAGAGPGGAAAPNAAQSELGAAKGAAVQPEEASARAGARTSGSRAGDDRGAGPRETARAVATITGNAAAGGSDLTTAAGPERQASVTGPRASFVAGVRQASLALSATASPAAAPGAALVPAAGSAAAAAPAEAAPDGSGGESNGMTAASAATAVGDIELAVVGSCEELEAFGLDALKAALEKRGLKAGGSAAERAARLWLLKLIPLEQLDRKLFAKCK